jgi:pyruvate/2-oxoglutarate dehydrogenase complex dihydrolipoamide acyltransferase (E2) component
VLSFQPLINHRQSAILGVGAEFRAPGASEGYYQLILAFDHRLSEGRAAAQFLKDLRDQLSAYETAVP